MSKEIDTTEFEESVDKFMKLSSWKSLFDFAIMNGWTKRSVKTFMSKNRTLDSVANLKDFLADSWYKNSKAPVAQGKYFENELNIDTAIPEFEVHGTMVDFQQKVDKQFTINQGKTTDIDDQLEDYLAEMTSLDPDHEYTPEELEELGLKLPEA